ncbi:WD40/YVTN/BNR-like repeat-containing protein [Cellulophaga omnivescoria]|uniref:WD40/YVTN/BNR-like repeat-containing protein n=1 Tax=Cellulophaga omnivescoria TaxID=1888890 RepID=UPI0022F0C481|nr:oxidoreductase [Cellulophaga omnivescoria]WBU88744.1 oxidoreductase [Cellulophaga omnivescoria]
MKKLVVAICALTLFACEQKNEVKPFTSVVVKDVYTKNVSIRAIEVLDGSIGFAGSNGVFGSVDLKTNKVITNVQKYDTILPEFRAVGTTGADFFMLSVTNPALLYKTGENGKMELVYTEKGDGVFYDAISFWNANEGIAIGDSVDGCLSVIITRDGGSSWNKIACNNLPEGIAGEGAFAASNTNIKIVGDKTWIATTKGRVFYSADKGTTWDVFSVPMTGLGETHGIFSLDFYNENLGFAIGGDFTKPEQNIKNKAITTDGGVTWSLVADGKEPDYKSCVQFVPERNGNELVAVGFTGIAYSNDKGQTWKELSKEGFYTIRFVNDTLAYAAGKDRIAQLIFKK